MSGPTWLPPGALDSPERAVPQMSRPAGSPVYRAPNKKAAPDFRPKYNPYDHNGAAAGGIAMRYMATGPTGGPVHHSPGRHYSPPPQDERKRSAHGDGGYEPIRGPDIAAGGGGHHSKIDADIDSLTAMLADLDGHPQDSAAQLYNNVPYNKYMSADGYDAAVPPRSRPDAGYPPHPQSQYRPPSPYSGERRACPYAASQQQQQPQYPQYPQPVPASYATASTPTGPRFSVQVKTAQPVTYSQTGRRAEQAYAPPAPPRRHAPRDCYAPRAASPLEEMQRGRGAPGASSKRGTENPQMGAPLNPAYPSGKHAAAPPTRPEEELDRLTKKLVYDMNHPPVQDYFGRCAGCGDEVVGDGSGCVAMEQVFHVECFTCVACRGRLRGRPFYALDKKSYCEACYISTLEQCSKCRKPILDRILRAMGKAYHPRCFTCVVCNGCLDGVPFTVDATSQIHCIDDFHRKYAPRCSVCGEPIMPDAGREETVRIVALDRSFHVNCYVCEECGLLLSSEGEGRGCYPLDGHILCKGCSARRIQDLSAKISTDC